MEKKYQKHGYGLSKRRQGAAKRLEAQLKSGLKGVRSKETLTPKDITRIEKEILILNDRVK